MLDSPDLKGGRTDTSSDDIWQQEKVLQRFCNHAGEAGRDDDEHDGIRTDTSRTAGEGGDLVQPVIGDDDNGDIQKQEKVVVQMPTAVVIFEANESWSGELVETKGGAQSVGGSSRRKH